MQKMAKAFPRERILKILLSVSLVTAFGIGLTHLLSTDQRTPETTAGNTPESARQFGKSKKLSDATATDAEPLSVQLTKSLEADSAAEERNMLEAGDLVADAGPAMNGDEEIQREVDDSLQLQKQQEGEVTAEGEDLY